MYTSTGFERARVLIVENEMGLVLSMRDYLTRAQLIVDTVGSGWEACKRMKESTFDLVIAESEVADLDGARLREKFLLNPETRDVPFLFLIPESRAEQQVMALRGGVDDCISKPFDPVVLVARAQALLARKTAYESFVRIDSLTRLLNCTTIQREVQEELERAHRYERGASLILIDIDNFSRVNTEGGTAMGDLMLTCFAGVILSTMRQIDKAGRMRGEKFLLFLPETDEEGAKILAHRLQEQFARLSDVMTGYPLTFSAGIATRGSEGPELAELFGHLEAALANAKEFTGGAISAWSEGMAPVTH